MSSKSSASFKGHISPSGPTAISDPYSAYCSERYVQFCIILSGPFLLNPSHYLCLHPLVFCFKSNPTARLLLTGWTTAGSATLETPSKYSTLEFRVVWTVLLSTPPPQLLVGETKRGKNETCGLSTQLTVMTAWSTPSAPSMGQTDRYGGIAPPMKEAQDKPETYEKSTWKKEPPVWSAGTYRSCHTKCSRTPPPPHSYATADHRLKSNVEWLLRSLLIPMYYSANQQITG